MSKIDKLSILGIRSFSNVHHETIQFDTPLTLIVGFNGSGKTTIIECLKYATTGQLPPNSKGGAFIHDPKLCGEKEVMAQVRLSFKGATGSRLVVTRSLQLTVKKASRTMKTLEGSLLIIKDGERTTLSKRVAELDSLVPQYMGVTEAILDSVIFCHQDESLWPMSEPAALKKKFDQIFEAQKYTKAIENIKTLKKAQGIELGKLKIYQETEKANKERGERVEKKGRDLETEIAELRIQAEQMGKEIEVLRKESGEKYARAKEALGIVNELTAKREYAGIIQQNLDDLTPHLEELQESDQWLETTLARYEERKARLEDEKEAVQADYGELQAQIRQCQEKMSRKLTERGQHQAEKENHETQLSLRAQLVKEAAQRHSIRGYDGDLDQSQISDFVERVRKASRDKDRELERIRKATDDELRQTQIAVTELENRRSARTQDRVAANNAIKNNDKAAIKIQGDVDAIRVDEGGRAVLETSLKNYKDQLQTATAEFEAQDWDKQLRTENNKLHELENELRRLREELLQSSRLAKDRASLELKKDGLKKLQQSLDTMVATYGDQLNSILGPDWQLDSLERDFQAILDEKNRSFADVKSQQEDISREHSTAQFKCANLKETIKKKEGEVRRSQATVLSSITTPEGNPINSIDDFEENLNDVQDSINEAERDIANYEYVSGFYTNSLEVVEKHDKCKLCDRGFVDSKERSLAKSRLHGLIAKYAKDQINDTIATLQELKTLLPKALAARSEYETYKKLSQTEIPALKEELRKSEIAKATLLERLTQQDNIVAEHNASKTQIDGLKKTVDTISRHRSDMSNYEADIARISTQQKLSGSTLTVDELEEQSSACDEKIRALKGKIAKLTTDKERAQRLMNQLELDLRDAQTQLSNTGNQLEKKQSLLARIEELRELNMQQRDAMKRADADLESLGPQLATATAQHEAAKQRGRAREKEIHDEQKKLADTVNKFKMVEDAIDKYIDGGGPENLESCQKTIRALERDQKTKEGDLSELTSKANELARKVADSERYERSIHDNLQHRKYMRNLQTVENEIAELEQRNVTDDYARLSREAEKVEFKYQKLTAERGQVAGTMNAKDAELTRYVREWEQDYKDAAKNYRKAHMKAETTKAAVEDLGRYAAALDAAIMRYHSLKMEEINRIAGELWQSTYQGTDIDTILIRSENENSTTSQRNYNYRVCMVKQDAEMDMRGRCSAGQRVLASIIIRLALAECFGVKCGIIALDEPTTNLDQDNIRSLAESLHNIIRIRRQQQNFQLIVITHDEEFLKYMKCPEFTDNYWRVSRNQQQNSTIVQNSVSEIMG